MDNAPWVRSPLRAQSRSSCNGGYRQLIERLFSKIKRFRRSAIRYDKLARNYAGFLNLVAALKCCL
ncbi:MAG: hypothetical protein EP321_06635 [Sphingomonadales bacterium]|nr:MAG: hypothetical protein EP345_02510 [Sphingomonadales bacterium]TNF04667.1 MAG: hypothetical protein EP321_06635 [Sphingomonadales bacterium]